MTRVLPGITQFYLPPNSSHTIPAFNPQLQTITSPPIGYYRAYLVRYHGRMARLSWRGWLVRTETFFPIQPEIQPDSVTHLSTTGFDVTWLMWRTNNAATNPNHQRFSRLSLATEQQLTLCACSIISQHAQIVISWSAANDIDAYRLRAAWRHEYQYFKSGPHIKPGFHPYACNAKLERVLFFSWVLYWTLRCVRFYAKNFRCVALRRLYVAYVSCHGNGAYAWFL